MKKNLVRGAAAAITLGFAGLAQAVPIYFDFTGTVNNVYGSTSPSPNASLLGQSYSAGFTFETDRLFSTELGNHPLSANLVDFGNPGPDASSTHLTIGGETYAFPSQPYQYTMMNFNDACSPAPPSCTPQWAEDVVLYGFTTDQPLDASTATGTFHASMLMFSSIVPIVTDPFNPLYGMPAFDYFDVLAGVDPTLLLTLPMYEMFASFATTETVCGNGDCVTGSSEYVQMSVTGVTRGLAATAVPEPGTLGLLGVALAGILFLRRRRFGAV
jgi:hypothetical protein